jgi:protein-disulfide isomerase
MRIETAVNVLVAGACTTVMLVGGLNLRDRFSKATIRPDVSSVASGAEPFDGVISVKDVAAIERPATARAAIVEFSDFQCAFCGRYARDTYRQIRTEFVETGRVAYAFVNYPLSKIHSNALTAALASTCAGDQHHFWDMHDALFAHQSALGASDAAQYGRDIGLDAAVFTRCLESADRKKDVQNQSAVASRLQVVSTPTFMVGELLADGEIRISRKINGARPFAVFDAALREATGLVRGRPR